MTTYIDVLISLIHASEMQMINMFIKEESIKIPCKDFINANTDYTRNSIKAIQDIINSSMDYSHNIFMYK
jgi:hypothetical protein